METHSAVAPEAVAVLGEAVIKDMEGSKAAVGPAAVVLPKVH